MIRFEQVTKEYGSKIALDHLDLEIHDGEIFGLIGHNGAGKSTTIKSLVSVIAPTRGEIYVDNLALSQHRDEIKRKIGYVPDSPDMFLRMTARAYWTFIARVYGVEQHILEERLIELLKIFDMEEAQFDVIEGFSHGMRQKTFVIGALLSKPDIWVLDEPMTGLDPQSAFNLKEMMHAHARDGHIVLFSTHVLATAQEVCDRIGILRKGKLIFVGTMEELKQQHTGDTLEAIYLSLVKDGEVDEA